MNDKQKSLRLLFLAGHLNFSAIKILGFFLAVDSINRYILVIADYYLKMKKAIPIAKEMVTMIFNLFMELWVASFEILYIVFTDSDKQLISKCFAVLCEELGVKTAAITEYYKKANGKVELFTATIV